LRRTIFRLVPQVTEAYYPIERMNEVPVATLNYVHSESPDRPMVAQKENSLMAEERFCSEIQAFKAKIGSSLDADCRAMIRCLMSAFKK
jgi:hypothetical protein